MKKKLMTALVTAPLAVSAMLPIISLASCNKQDKPQPQQPKLLFRSRRFRLYEEPTLELGKPLVCLITSINDGAPSPKREDIIIYNNNNLLRNFNVETISPEPGVFASKVSMMNEDVIEGDIEIVIEQELKLNIVSENGFQFHGQEQVHYGNRFSCAIKSLFPEDLTWCPSQDRIIVYNNNVPLTINNGLRVGYRTITPGAKTYWVTDIALPENGPYSIALGDIVVYVKTEKAMGFISVGEGGSVDRNVMLVNVGQTWGEVRSQITVTPDENYRFYQWLDDQGVPITDDDAIISSGGFNNKATFAPVIDDFVCVLNNDEQTAMIWKYEGTNTNIVIPAIVTHNGKNYNVTSIGDNLFANQTQITSVTIPASVIRIGQGAFSGCSGLTSISIPASVKTIQTSAFAGCTNLKSVELRVDESGGGVEGINDAVFEGCSALESIYIPNSVCSIGSHVFDSCSSLSSVTFGNEIDLKSISSYTFYQCKQLKTITIPSSVEQIDQCAFVNCGITDTSGPSGGLGFNFAGNIATWKTVTRDIDWHDTINLTQIQCSDGPCGLDERS